MSHVGRTLERAMTEARAAYEARLSREGPRPGAPDQERARRHEEALGIVGQVPAFCRLPPVELRARIVHELRVVEAGAAASWFILGPPRAGKTTAAALRFRALLREGVRAGGAAWELARELRWERALSLALARREWPLGAGPCPRIAQAGRASVLFLDDLGQEAAEDAVLQEVLNDRYERGLPSVITTGLRQYQLSARYGAHLLRRPIDSGGVPAEILDLFQK